MGKEEFLEEIVNACKDEVAEERARKDSVERRSLTVAAGSAAAAAVLLGLGGRRGLDSPLALAAFVLGGASLAVAGLLGWWAARPRAYDELDPADLKREIDSDDDDVLELRRFLARGLLDRLDSARTLNDRKAALLRAASLLLMVGLAAILALLAISAMGGGSAAWTRVPVGVMGGVG